MGEEIGMSQAHAHTDTDSTDAVTTTQPADSASAPHTPPAKDLGLLLDLNDTVHRERRVDFNALVTYLTHVVQKDVEFDGTTEAVAYGEAATTIVDALEARFEPFVDIQYARRELDDKHSDHEISLGDLRTAFDDVEMQAAPGSVELYNDVVLPLLSEFGRRLSAQIAADEKATHEAARRRITECIVAHTDMHGLSPTDVEFAVAEAKRELESHEIWP